MELFNLYIYILIDTKILLILFTNLFFPYYWSLLINVNKCSIRYLSMSKQIGIIIYLGIIITKWATFIIYFYFMVKCQVS